MNKPAIITNTENKIALEINPQLISAKCPFKKQLINVHL